MNPPKDTSVITAELIENSMSYQDYFNLLENLLAEGKTTGENHSETMLNYAKMNIQRMKRLEKTIRLSKTLEQALAQIKENKLIFLVITEGWCGDAAQNIPLLNKMEEVSSGIELKLILRDENLEVMDQFLTNGGRSIPKLIVLDAENHEVLGSWGPRAKPAQEMVLDFKKEENGDFQEFVKKLQLWYSQDKTQSQQKELAELLPLWIKESNKQNA